MREWRLVDCYRPLEEDEGWNPSVVIQSEEQLRSELSTLRDRERLSTAMLDAPQGDALAFSLGGAFGALGWYPPKEQEKVRGSMSACPQSTVAAQPVDNWTEGVPTPIEPESLFPADEVIEAVIYFYNNHRLPEWLNWQTWNPVSRRYELIPATAMARPLAES